MLRKSPSSAAFVIPFVGACVLLLVAVLVGGAREVSATNSAAQYVAAPICVKGSDPAGYGCCCGKRQLVPVTVKKTKAGKTVTVTKFATITAGKKVGRRDVGDSQDVSAPAEEGLDHELFARNLCPACPAGVKVNSAKGKNHGNMIPCCAARKTVTKTFTKAKVTVVVRKTKTLTAVPKQTISGRVYYDLNKNGVFDQGIDLPIANKIIYALVPVAKAGRLLARVAPPIGSTLSGPQGEFTMSVTKQTAGTTIRITLDELGNQPILDVVAPAGNSIDANVPIPKPKNPTVTSTSLDGAIATVTGTGEPGYRIRLFANGVWVGNATVDAQGQYSISSTTLAAGLSTLTVVGVTPTGVESDLIPAGSVTVVVASPTITAQATAVGPNLDKAQVKGTTTPHTKVNIYANGIKVGTATSDAQGNFDITTSALADGPYTLTAKAEASNGVESVSANAGTLTIARKPDPPTITGTASVVNTNQARVQGTTVPNVKVNIYIDGVKVGSATADANGAFTFTSSALANGVHPVSVKAEGSNGVESDSVSAGSVTISGSNVTTQAQVSTTAPGAITTPAAASTTTAASTTIAAQTTTASLTQTRTETQSTTTTFTSTTIFPTSVWVWQTNDTSNYYDWVPDEVLADDTTDVLYLSTFSKGNATYLNNVQISLNTEDDHEVLFAFDPTPPGTVKWFTWVDSLVDTSGRQVLLSLAKYNGVLWAVASSTLSADYYFYGDGTSEIVNNVTTSYLVGLDATTGKISQRLHFPDALEMRFVKVDASGNLIIVTSLRNTATMPGGGSSLTSAGGTDIVISKFTSALAHTWSVKMGTASADTTSALAVDSATGDMYLACNFKASGATITNYGGTAPSSGANIIKLSSAGSVQWIKASVTDFPQLEIVDGALYARGYFGSGSGSAVVYDSVSIPTYAGRQSPFLVKLQTSDGVAQWGMTVEHDSNKKFGQMSRKASADGLIYVPLTGMDNYGPSVIPPLDTTGGNGGWTQINLGIGTSNGTIVKAWQALGGQGDGIITVGHDGKPYISTTGNYANVTSGSETAVYNGVAGYSVVLIKKNTDLTPINP